MKKHQRVSQSLQATIYHGMLCIVGVLLFVGALLIGVVVKRTILFYFLMCLLSLCGLVLLVTVLWEGFACYAFFDDRIVVQMPLHKETILKNEILFVEDLDMLLLLADSVTHVPAIRIYDRKARVQIEVNSKTKPLLKEYFKQTPPHDAQEVPQKLFSVYNRKYILAVGGATVLFLLASVLLYILY